MRRVVHPPCDVRDLLPWRYRTSHASASHQSCQWRLRVGGLGESGGSAASGRDSSLQVLSLKEDVLRVPGTITTSSIVPMFGSPRPCTMALVRPSRMSVRAGPVPSPGAGPSRGFQTV